MSQRVIVTRPREDGLVWQADLQQAGFDAVLLPLLAVAAVPDAAPLQAAGAQWPRYTAVMFVSRSAVDFFVAAQGPAAWPRGGATRCWATGPGTAAALRAAGVPLQQIDTPDVVAGVFDSEALWAVVAGQVRPGDRVLVVRGADSAEAARQQGQGRDWLAQRVRQAGAEVDFVVAYQRVCPVWSAVEQALAREAAADGSCWLLSSSQAVGHLARCCPDQDWSRARAVATHERIAHVAQDLGFGVVCTSRPVLPAVIASLESLK